MLHGETQQALFPTVTVGPRVGIFLFSLNTNDGLCLSDILVPALWPHVEP